MKETARELQRLREVRLTTPFLEFLEGYNRCDKAKEYYQLHQAELREKRKVRYYEKKGLALIERELQAMNANVVL